MVVDIFIRSYKEDFPWLVYSLRSIQKYASGFGKVHIAVPAQDIGEMPNVGAAEVHLVHDSGKGYLEQQITKMMAEKYCNGNYVLHMDSDCLFTKPVLPDDFFIDGKPIMLRENGVESPWNDISAVSLGWRDEYEYMRRLPIIYPRWIYREFRGWLHNYHGMPVDQWVMRQPDNKFSEFNTMGQWAHKFYPEEFHWAHPCEIQPVARQFWSWGGITPEVQVEINTILA